MFNYDFVEDQNELTINLKGRFDQDAAQTVQDALEAYDIKDVSKINFELSETDYIASSGLRVIFFAKGRIKDDMEIELKGAQGFVAKVLKMSGMEKFLAKD